MGKREEIEEARLNELARVLNWRRDRTELRREFKQAKETIRLITERGNKLALLYAEMWDEWNEVTGDADAAVKNPKRTVARIDALVARRCKLARDRVAVEVESAKADALGFKALLTIALWEHQYKFAPKITAHVGHMTERAGEPNRWIDTWVRCLVD